MNGGDAGRRHVATLVSLAVSGALLVALYRSLDVRLVGETLLRANPIWLVISVGMILPITVLRAIRFFWVAPPGALPGVGEALRLTLAASALNVFLPGEDRRSHQELLRRATQRHLARRRRRDRRLRAAVRPVRADHVVPGGMDRRAAPGAGPSGRLLGAARRAGHGVRRADLVGARRHGVARNPRGDPSSRKAAQAAGAGGRVAGSSPLPRVATQADRALLARALAGAPVPDLAVHAWCSVPRFHSRCARASRPLRSWRGSCP